MTHDHDGAGRRPVALVTGVGRTRGIGAGVARGLGGWITGQLLHSNGGYA